MPKFTHFTLEHIDPQRHELVCGFRCLLNEVIADSCYNYSKADLFLPYRVKDYPAPQNPGDLGEFLIRGDWVITEFMGDWYKSEAIKYSARRLNKPQHEDWTDRWLARIKELEKKLNVNIIVCSWDGSITKRSICRRYCEHGSSKPYELWRTLIANQHCCRKQSCATNSKIAAKILKQKREQNNFNRSSHSG